MHNGGMNAVEVRMLKRTIGQTWKNMVRLRKSTITYILEHILTQHLMVWSCLKKAQGDTLAGECKFEWKNCNRHALRLHSSGEEQFKHLKVSGPYLG